MNGEILKTIKDRGLLLEKEIFDIIEGFNDTKLAQEFIINLEKFSGQKIITKSSLSKNIEFAHRLVGNLEAQNRQVVEDIFIKLGINLEIRKEKKILLVLKDSLNG
jgi:hypothetical protein